MDEVAFFVSHAAHRADRRESLTRLLAQIGKVDVTVIGERLPNHAWSEQMWNAALEEGDRPVFLQDDVVLCPDFHDRLRALLEAFPSQPLSLYQCAPDPGRFAASAISMPGVLGSAYTMPADLLANFLAWRSRIPRMRVRVCLGEDQLLTAYSHVTGVPWIHPIPGLVDLDPTIASTNPYPSGFPRATAVASGHTRWNGRIVRAPWLWKDSEKVCADNATKVVKPGELNVFGRAPLMRGPESRTIPLLHGKTIYVRRAGERSLRVHGSYDTELEADLALDALSRAGGFPCWLEDDKGPIDPFDYTPKAFEWLDELTRYHTGAVAEQIDAAVRSVGGR